MVRITDLAEANRQLLPYVPLVSQLTGKDTTLDRIRPLMALLGNPQDKIKIVHIAGTSGKTSTAYFIAALLRAGGKHVGLTVSPHVDSVTERVQIDGRPIADKTFCKYLGDFLDIVERAPAKPSYFELLYAFSFWVFEREQVEYAVVETGLGGLYDATNVADRPDKVCVITDIGFDHMRLLGDTLAKIAAQKVGIVHDGNAVLKYRQSDEVDEVVDSWVKARHAELHTIDQNTEQVNQNTQLVKDLPPYQIRNWLLSLAVYRFLRARDASLPSLSRQQLLATQALQIPGRMDRLRIGNKTLVMDGAHNGQKMATFLNSFRVLYPNVRPAVMLALKEGKEPADVVPLIAAIASRIIVTSFDTSQDMPARSIDPNILLELIQKTGASNAQVQPDLTKAYKQLLEGPEPVCVVVGSFYLLSQLRQKEHLV